MESYEKVPMTWRTAHGFGMLGHTPLAVVSRGADSFPLWDEAQLRLTSLSTASTHIVAENSGHVIQFSEPWLIVSAIRRVLDQFAEAARH